MIRHPFILSIFIASLSISIGSAAVLESKIGTKAIESVKLVESATVDSAGKKITLKPYAAGIRRKKVALFWVKVYVAQVFAAEGLTPPKTIEEAVETLGKHPTVAVTLTFLRNVDVEKIIEGFESSLEANKIDPKAEEIKPLFAALKQAGPSVENGTTTMVLERAPDGKESFRFENHKGELQNSTAIQAGTIRKILTLWFGTPADSGMERLQKQLIGKED